MPPHELRAVAQVLLNALEDIYRVEFKLPPSLALRDVAVLVNAARAAAEVPPRTLRLVTA
jgi:hypothetical protein